MAYAEHFSTANLPYGIASSANGEKAVATRLGDAVIFLADLNLDVSAGVKTALAKPTLNELAALPKSELRQLRAKLQDVLKDGSAVAKHGHKLEDVTVHMPVAVSGFTDFSCSKEHGLNASHAMFGKRSMAPAFLHFPIAYSGRASSIVPSGTPIQRPNGVYRVGDVVEYGACRALDYELEVAAIVGKPSKPGESVSLEDADEHIFGLVLLNDWSARDIQAFEMTPLGPMNCKSFGTSISPWVVTLEALEPFATAAPAKDAPPPAYLDEKKEKASYDIKLEAEILSQDGKATKMCTSNVSWMYWTFRDLVAHQTVNGCNINTGDVLATGTVSGVGDGQHGCLLELTIGGKAEFALADGTKRGYLQDGEGVRLTAYCGDGVGFGECTDFITPAPPV